MSQQARLRGNRLGQVNNKGVRRTQYHSAKYQIQPESILRPCCNGFLWRLFHHHITHSHAVPFLTRLSITSQTPSVATIFHKTVVLLRASVPIVSNYYKITKRKNKRKGYNCTEVKYEVGNNSKPTRLWGASTWKC